MQNAIKKSGTSFMTRMPFFTAYHTTWKKVDNFTLKANFCENVQHHWEGKQLKQLKQKNLVAYVSVNPQCLLKKVKSMIFDTSRT